MTAYIAACFLLYTTDCAFTAPHFSCVAKKSKQKKATPASGPALRYAAIRVRSLHRHSRGRRTRAVPGPLRLTPHPCGAPPCTPIPLTLLMGVLDRVLFKFCVSTPEFQTQTSAPSEGRMESSWRGLSGKDAARVAMGQGWPFAACPRCDDGVRAVERSETRMQGLAFLVTFAAISKSNPPSRAEPYVQAMNRSRLSKVSAHPLVADQPANSATFR